MKMTLLICNSWKKISFFTFSMDPYPKPVPVTAPDNPQIISLLQENSLPVSDIDQCSHFYIREEAGKLLATGGFEVYGNIALLRSVAVVEQIRGRGFGKQWLQSLLAEISHTGTEDIYLLTTTAEGFFKKMGFRKVDREKVPDRIQQTTEFRDICPASAVVMKKVITSKVRV